MSRAMSYLTRAIRAVEAIVDSVEEISKALGLGEARGEAISSLIVL
jgi:hypothetical protein